MLNLNKIILFFSFIFLLSACGGGDSKSTNSNTTTDTPTTETPTITTSYDSISLTASTTSSEINQPIVVTLNGIDVINDNIEVIWGGAELTGDSWQEKTLTSATPGDRTIGVKIYNEDIFISSSYITVNYFEVGNKETITLSSTDDVVTTINDLKITVPAGASGLGEIYATEINNNSADIVKLIKLEPDGSSFDMPISVSIPYDENVINDPSKILVERLESDGTIELLKPEIDYTNNELLVKTDHFSSIRLTALELKEINPEKNLFKDSGDYDISLMSDVDFYDFMKYMYGSSSKLTSEAKDDVEDFYDDFVRGNNGFNDDYERAANIILSEKAGEMDKYEVLVDSYKKYRIAKMLDRYAEKDLLDEIYDPFTAGPTTRSDFFNEILKTEKKSFGLTRGFWATANQGAKSLYNALDKATGVAVVPLQIIQKGWAVTGTGIAFNAVKSAAFEDLKHTLKHFTNKELSYLQCFDYSDGYYSIGNSRVFYLYDDGSIDIESGINSMSNISDELEARAIGGSLGDLSIDEERFTDCVYRKYKKLEESLNTNNNAVNGVLTIINRAVSADLYKEFNKFYSAIRSKDIGEYINLLKIVKFNKTELQDYSEYLKTVASGNAALILAEITEKATDDDIDAKGLLSDGNSHGEGYCNFSDGIQRRFSLSNKSTEESTLYSSRSSNDNQVRRLKIMSLNDFEDLGLKIPEKYIDNIVVKEFELQIGVTSLDRKVSEKDFISKYYETISSHSNKNYIKKNINKSSYTFNSDSNKYELSLAEIFPDLQVMEPSYIDAEINLVVEYKNKEYSVRKNLELIIDDKDSPTVEENTNYSLRVEVKGDNNVSVAGAKIVASGEHCYTTGSGVCTLQNLNKNNHKVKVYFNGMYFEQRFLLEKNDTLKLNISSVEPETPEVTTTVQEVTIEMVHELDTRLDTTGSSPNILMTASWNRNYIKTAIDSTSNLIWDPDVTLLEDAVFQVKIFLNGQEIEKSGWMNTTSYSKEVDLSGVSGEFTVGTEVWSRVNVRVID